MIYFLYDRYDQLWSLELFFELKAYTVELQSWIQRIAVGLQCINKDLKISCFREVNNMNDNFNIINITIIPKFQNIHLKNYQENLNFLSENAAIVSHSL